ncbi:MULTISPECIES: DKNYY domain-containing protein [Dickeya]|uniref:DKNYY family protein n=1 Tax=Dickeya aquatica TaxID=1401087 RepID=A0A375A9F6_9GAMM|nr:MULTISPECIES: DKNYY domain-containing protein [Dickeya]SLM62683.1 FIG00614247: hypothetical protein [Dickeya aquatica]
MKWNGYLAVVLGMAALSSQAEVKPPYQVDQGRVVFRASVNADPQVLAGARADNFKVLQKGDAMALAASGSQYYCNQQPLPKGFKPESAKLYGEHFLLTNVGSYVDCAPMKQTIDAASFEALTFPFFRDKNHIWLPDGEILDGVDVASFKAIASNQAIDKKNYYFVANEISIVPYQKNAPVAGECYGWATIDGVVHYQGEARPDVDAASFHCLTFDTALDNVRFYKFGRIGTALPDGVKAAAIKPVADSEKLATDGQRVWFLGVDTVLLEGLGVSNLSSKLDSNDYTISDGKTRWHCDSVKVSGQPQCHKG